MSSLTVTYTSVYSDSEPWRFQWVFDEEPEAPEEALQFLEQAPPSPDYVPGPEHPPSPDYVPGLEYPKYLVPFDDEVPIEDQPLPANASPTALSPGYDEEDEEEEHLAPADSTTLLAIDLVPLAEDTKAFEIDESAPTPPVPSPRLHRARIFVRPQTPMAASTEYASAPTPLSPPPFPLTPLSSSLPQISSPPLPIPSPPTHTSPTYAEAPLGYKADVPEADVPPQKRLCLTAFAPRFEVGESAAAAAARQHGFNVTHATDYSFIDTVDATPGRLMYTEVGYGITDVWDDMVGDIEGRAPTTLEELSQRVTDLATTLARDTHKMQYHLHTAMLLESEARHAWQTWLQAMNCNKAVHAELLAYRAEVRELHEQINVLQR
ncbi:hypothetical protein Tco_1481045 [Tanacetum coccineum]